MISKFEDWFYQQSIQKRLVYVGFVIAFVAIFALNHFFPIYADDMMYSVVKFQQSVDLGKNLKEIGEFMHYYYLNWGGRVVGIGSVHLMLLFNDLGQNIINSLLFLSLLFLVYRISKSEKENSFFVFIFITVSIFYFTPSFLSSAVWITGSGVFLLTTTLTLALVLPYYRYLNAKEYKDSVFRTVLFFPFGILAAWSNENTGPTLFLLVFSLLALVYFYKKKQIPHWAISGLIGVIIGCCFMILAPGNGVRAQVEGYSSLFSSVDTMLERLPHIYASYRYFMFRPIIIYVACLVLHQLYAKKIERKKDVFLYSLLFFVIANISIWLTIFAPAFPPRAFMVITVLTIVSIGIVYANIDFKKILPKVVNLAFLAVLLFYASIDYITYLKGVYFLDKEMTKREKIIEEHIKEGKTPIVFESIYMDYRFEYTDFSNYYKDYYGVDVHFVDQIEEN